MEAEQLLEIREIQRRQMLALEQIAKCLIKVSRDKSPDYHYSLESFNSFDWMSIDAIVEKFDSDGAAVVNWNGQQYIRRSPSNKYEPAICYLYSNNYFTQQQQRIILTLDFIIV